MKNYTDISQVVEEIIADGHATLDGRDNPSLDQAIREAQKDKLYRPNRLHTPEQAETMRWIAKNFR